MKKLWLITLVLAALLAGTLSLVGAQEGDGTTCTDDVLNSSCNPDLARLCAAFMTRWEAAGGESSGLTIPDWCSSDAQTPQPNSNDDNACDGGLLDGRCVSDWEWMCGWYLQQWEAAGGWNSNYIIPDWCNPSSLLPPKPEIPVTAPSLAGCYSGTYWSFYYSGVSATAVTRYNSPNCAGAPSYVIPMFGIEAPDHDSAQAICNTLIMLDPVVWQPTYQGFVLPDTLWLCDED